ncbi:uncharacterized protein [Aristolochia californica]|uniref:uncharacterized protein n=1 Tax=Aristolochia californica TaxID=171875 RepID=UPI0035E29251
MAGTITRFSFTPVLPGRPKLKPSPLSFRIVACSTTGTSTSIGTDELRTQLLHLQAESDITRAKANNARLRLMRLSEAVENLQRQAAADIQSGKEDEARELLLQKRKVIQALEKSKIRIQVLDQLSENLNKAISVKETQLIGTVASDLEVSSDDSCPVRIISPKDDNAEESIQTEVLDPAERDDEEPDFQIDVQTKNVPVDDQEKKKTVTPTTSAENENNIIRSLKGISSYADFLDHLDRQLLQIEEELVMVLRLSSLVMGSDQGQTNAKEQQTLVLLEDVRRVRERILGIRHSQGQNC